MRCIFVISNNKNRLSSDGRHVRLRGITTLFYENKESFTPEKQMIANAATNSYKPSNNFYKLFFSI